MASPDFDDVVRDSYGADGEFDRLVLQCLANLAEAERDGPERPETIGRRSELGDAYFKAGRFDDAIGALGQVVSDIERLLGPTEPDLPVARGNLAAAYQAGGRPDEAIATYLEAIAGAERVLGRADDTTIEYTSELAVVYLQAGRIDDALSLLEKVAAELTDTLPAHDPRGLTARSHLAALYDEAGRFTDSIPLHLREVSDRERLQGPDHPDTVRARMRLGTAYQQAEQNELAIPLLEAALARVERAFAPGSHDLPAARARLGLAYHAIGRDDEAIELFERVVADVDGWSDPDHPNAISFRNHLGSAYQEAGRHEEAIPLLERVAADRERLSGAEAPDTLDARNAVAIAHFAAGHTTTGRRLFVSLLADCERAIPDAELTAVVRENLAAIGDPGSTPDDGASPSPDGRHDWLPPSDLERGLRDAARRKDELGYLRLLAGAEIYIDVDKAALEEDGVGFFRGVRDRAGIRAIAVRTAGELLPAREDVVARAYRFGTLARGWRGSSQAILVNPGTPAEMLLPAGPSDRELWAKVVEEFPPSTDAVLLTKHTGPRHGPLAHAFACGAHLAVTNRVFWNDLTDVYIDYETDRKTLRDSWGVTTTAEWREQLDALLAGQNSPPQPEFALYVRRELARRSPGTVPIDQWREACADILSARQAPPGAVEEILDLIGKILRYEARFRADGLLSPDGFVASAIGYDFGRAVNVARWGLGARLCSADTARSAIRHAGRLCREHYTSWADFSAGYALGRVIRFDTEEFGDWYQNVRDAHRILMSAPDSPWLSIPFQQ